MNFSLPSGTNLRLLLLQCGCERDLLVSHQSVAAPLRQAVLDCEMTPLTTAGHDFTGAGHSFCIILAESHLVLHTYPEHDQSVIVELSVCDHLRDNRDRAWRLALLVKDIFKPAQYILEPSSMCPQGTLHST